MDRYEPSPPQADSPSVVVSVPCARCAEGCKSKGCEPDPRCPFCDGSGIQILRVRPEDAALDAQILRERYPD